MKTLIILAHNDLAASRINRAMVQSVADIAGVEIRDLYTRYPNGKIDYEAERDALLAAERLVLQFPLQWYSTPALLKEWEDAVLTPLAYDAARTEAMQGLPVMVATSTGGGRSSYTEGSPHGYTLEDLLAPVHATVQKMGWEWHKPFAIHDVRNVSDEELSNLVLRYRDTVLKWQSTAESFAKAKSGN